MEKTFTCTQNLPLRAQMSEEELLKISEIHLNGFIDGEDFLLLSKMSKMGSLRLLDMGGVTEMAVSELYKLDDGMCSGNHIPFYKNDRIEEVIFPHVDSFDAAMFVSCPNLRKVVIPKTLKSLNKEMLLFCPNIEEIYVPSNLNLDTSHFWRSPFFPSYSFWGSGKRFVSDNDGWPDDVDEDDVKPCFFAYDGVLYHIDGGGELELYRYPAGDERTEFVVPDGVTHICQYAFYQCRHLKKITIPQSVSSFEENPFGECQALETIAFKQNGIRMFSMEDADYLGGILGLKDLPNIKHIFLYAENPEDVCFDMFDGLKNIGEVTLHVPRSCKKNYEDYGVKWNNGSVTKAYLRFHHIEEFDM